MQYRHIWTGMTYVAPQQWRAFCNLGYTKLNPTRLLMHISIMDNCASKTHDAHGAHCGSLRSIREPFGGCPPAVDEEKRGAFDWRTKPCTRPRQRMHVAHAQLDRKALRATLFGRPRSVRNLDLQVTAGAF